MIQIGMLEDLRQRTLQGVTRLQALYKGYKIRLMYRQKRKMTIYLQSCKFSLSVFSHGWFADEDLCDTLVINLAIEWVH